MSVGHSRRTRRNPSPHHAGAYDVARKRYVIHDGATENPYPGGSQANVDFAEENVLLGSEDLFRTSIGLTRDFAGPWEAQLFFEHLSHGQILGDGHNQGIDQLGIRFGYQFGD